MVIGGALAIFSRAFVLQPLRDKLSFALTMAAGSGNWWRLVHVLKRLRAATAQ